MSDADAPHATTTDSHDSHDAHDDGHGHERAGEQLGPVDVKAWAYAVGGGAVGLITAWALFVARGG